MYFMVGIVTIAITVNAITITIIITTAIVAFNAEAPTTSHQQYIPYIMSCYCGTALSVKYPYQRIMTCSLQSHLYLTLTFN